jgi:hypothetical protein
MLAAATVLFALAAVMGILLATKVVKGQERALGAVLAHGAFGAAGLVALAVVVFTDTEPGLALWALIGFVVAALGGFFLFALDRLGRALPVPVVGVHALVAVASFVVLLLVLFGGG